MLTDAMIEEIVGDAALLEGVDSPSTREEFRLKYLELLDVVNDEGHVLGVLSRGLIHRLGLRHAVVYCLVTSCAGRWLLQVRRGGRLDITVGGHVRAGETDYAAALAREFREELGFEPVIERLRLHATYNRDAPVSSRKPLVRNRERRLVYHYPLSSAEEVRLEAAFQGREAVTEVVGLKWFQSGDVVGRNFSGNDLADGLGATLEYLGSLA